ncbi:MAG: FtsX-like permease family protein [Desulfomonilaceae bacterium]|nr:FtsX-like permease family protein [Desulfomonilaceae bacterium]
MVNRVLARKLARDLRHRKGALIALIAMVTVGVGIFVGMSGVYRDLDGAKENYYRSNLLADFTVDLKRAPEWTAEAVGRLPNVRAVRSRIHQSVLVDLEDRTTPLPGIALSLPNDGHSIINGLMMRSGIRFSHDEAEEVILDRQFAEANHLEPGDRIKVLLLDKQHDLLVVGTAMSPEFVYLIPPGGGLAPDPAGYAVMYLPRKFLQNSSDLNGSYNELVGLSYDTSRRALEDTLVLIKEQLEPYGVTNTTPIQDQTSASIVQDELDNLKTTARIFPVIFLGVAALVLNILMRRMTAQHRVVIGTLRALGYSSGTITRHYLGHGLIVGATGGIAGAAFGWWLQGAMVGMYRQFFAMPGIDRHFHPEVFAVGCAIAMCFALAGAFRGSRQAAKLEPAEAMRPPPPEQGARVLPERIPLFWNRLSFQWKMIFRAVFRNPFRSSVSMLASAVATALLVASLSMYDSTYYMMDYHFTRLFHHDLTLSLRDPEGMGSLSEVRGMPAVSYTEPQLDVMCDMSNGPYRKRTAVTGLAPNNILYTPLDSRGNKVVVPATGVILTRKLAEILNVGVGEQIKLRPLIARREQVMAPVVGIVDTYLGLSAYCDIHYLSTLLGEYRTANSILTRVYPGAFTLPLMEQIRRRPKVIGVTERLRALQQVQETIGDFMGAFFFITVLFAGIIAFGSMLNTALVSLSEREREVGTFRVLGYSSGQIARIFSGESFLLNGMGIVLGVGLGIGVAHLLSLAFNTELYRYPAIIHPSRLMLSAALMVLFVGSAQLIVFRMIRGLQWLEVLKVKE